MERGESARQIGEGVESLAQVPIEPSIDTEGVDTEGVDTEDVARN